MALELFAAIALALSVGGIVYVLRKISGGRLPKTTIPVVAALSLVSFAIWGDYSWASRTASALPDRFVVIDEVGQSNIWRPWSFLFPVTERFVAVDLGGAQRNSNDPNKVLVELYYMERRIPAERQSIVVDCGFETAAPTEANQTGRLRELVCASVSEDT
ncbi:hypothetical protein FP2506_09306 [Fulvimarina pelagi HTCC2506]|uniref:Uncharacterized protein n=1 Tax=Fulvimarina pelagi HTCC2506 TaxID=314231 RepID=Q0G5N5_9HYPH|nr:hypothetical protein [Fulvimarina pelagi]EAU43029.1 hypothetical protein FP2506_09306 [Fulvimarina pelagi HTCC2506]